jgi:hypothetical protein
MLYTLLKFLHVTGAIGWVGGSLVMGLTTIRFLRQEDPASLGPLLRQNAFVGRFALGPAAALTLLAGIGMMAVGRWGMTLWIGWGFLGLLASGAIGGGILRRELMRVTSGADPRETGARMARLTALNLLLLLSTVGAMVFKPNLG